jgi:CBS domain-containing protein
MFSEYDCSCDDPGDRLCEKAVFSRTRKGLERGTTMQTLARDFMTEDPACCRPHTTLDQVAKMMVQYDCGEIPVLDANDRPIGVVTDRDIVCRVVAEGKNPMAYPAEICMSESVVAVAAHAPVADVISTMEYHQVRRVPVVDDKGRCIGIISQADVASVAQKKQLAELVCEVSRDSKRAK